MQSRGQIETTLFKGEKCTCFFLLEWEYGTRGSKQVGWKVTLSPTLIPSTSCTAMEALFNIPPCRRVDDLCALSVEEDPSVDTSDASSSSVSSSEYPSEVGVLQNVNRTKQDLFSFALRALGR
mmetsp:Transcript_57791/g.67462  ORF Transcript_57791/g.67462 Transcript_57791/m.67462 type:complete len:123 (+) Transcript_57791:905-1273(+)